jgi:hypothetical protein
MVLLVAYGVVPVQGESQIRYAAKIVCGRATGEIVKTYSHAPGVYYTTITLANLGGARVNATQSVTLTFPLPKVAKQMASDWSLEPGAARAVTCGDLYKLVGVEQGVFLEGFVHITGGPTSFDAAAVYTLFDGNYPVSIDVEHLTPSAR